MVGGVGWMLRTLPATFYAVTPPDGIMSSEPLTSQDARTLWRERLVRRPCARARGEAGSCWFWTASGRSGPAQPLEMIGAEQGASASVGPNVDRCRSFDSRPRVGFFIREIGVVPERSSSFQPPNVSRQTPGGGSIHYWQWKSSGYPCRPNTEARGRNRLMVS
jgi:hypothetical protein